MLWGNQTAPVVQSSVLRIKKEMRERLRGEHQLAIDYLEGRQVADVENELFARFPASQEDGGGQDIQPATLPLTQRYVAEAATLYSRGCQRYFTLPDSSEETDETRRLSGDFERALARVNYDEAMHANERYTVLLGTNCIWYQTHKGVLRPVVTFAKDIFPVLPPVEESIEFDVSDWDDYAGFVVETEYDKEAVGEARGKIYAYLTNEEVVSFLGTGPEFQDRILSRVPHGLGVNPLTWWHVSFPVGSLVSHSDATVARANREINIAWSLLWDTMRFQSFATPVKTVANPATVAARQLHGSRFPVVLQAGGMETFNYASASAPYSDLLASIREFVKMLAVLLRQNPEDFSFDAPQAVSGFSKLVSNLPKIEARRERATRARAVEEFEALPRAVSALVSLGELPEAALRLQPRVRFPDVEFPRTPEEERSRLEVEFLYGFTTAAKELARRRGITLEEARAEIEANAEENKGAKTGEAEQQPLDQPKRDLFSELINGGRKRQDDDEIE